MHDAAQIDLDGGRLAVADLDHPALGIERQQVLLDEIAGDDIEHDVRPAERLDRADKVPGVAVDDEVGAE